MESSGYFSDVPRGSGALWQVKKTVFSESQILSLRMTWGPQRQADTEERDNTVHEEKAANAIANPIKNRKEGSMKKI